MSREGSFFLYIFDDKFESIYQAGQYLNKFVRALDFLMYDVR